MVDANERKGTMLTAKRPDTSAHSMTRAAITDMDSKAVIPILWQAAYAILLFAMAVVFLTTWFSATDINTSLKLIFLALLVLTLKRWTGALLLALIQINLLFLSPWIRDSLGPLSELFWVCVPLALISLVSRYRTLQEFHGDSPSESIRRLTQTVRSHRPTESDAISGNIRGVLRQLVRNAVVISGSLIVASQVLNLAPLHADKQVLDTIGEFRLKPTGYRVITLGLSLFVAWLVAWLVVSELTWRRLLPSQASIYLRSLFVDWSHRDLRMIILKRLRVKKTRPAKIRNIKDQPRVAQHYLRSKESS